MPTNSNINKSKFIEIRIDSTEAIISFIPNKQTSKRTNKQKNINMQQANMYLYSSNSKQWKKFDEVYFCTCKNVKTANFFAKDFIQHRCYGFIFTFLLLHSLKRWLESIQRYLCPKQFWQVLKFQSLQIHSK